MENQKVETYMLSINFHPFPRANGEYFSVFFSVCASESRLNVFIILKFQPLLKRTIWPDIKIRGGEKKMIFFGIKKRKTFS